MIKKVLGDRFAKHGFEFMGSVDRGVWEFKKTLDNGIEQTIIILLDRFEPTEVYFILNSKYGNNVKARDFIPEPEYANKQWWEFKDDGEFVKALEEMGYLIEKYGFEKLDELSVSPYKFEPTYEMYLRLSEQYKEMFAKFIKEHNLRYDISLEESVEVIKGIVEEEGERVYDDETKERLVELAAFYGEQLIKKYGGNWEWSKIRKDVYHVFNMKHTLSTEFALPRILQTWEKLNADSIIEFHNYLKEYEHIPYDDGRGFVFREKEA